MTTPQRIVELVERFDRDITAYRSGQYNETQLRREFLDPFFKSLGWDMDNEQNALENFKEVIHEHSFKIDGRSTMPDYCFRIASKEKFYVEAKKPSVNVGQATSPAYQLRRYAWNAKLPLSILTDFEEFAVYDTRIKPENTDKAATARILHLQYTDYLTRWDEIASLFSRTTVLQGSIDRYLDQQKGRRSSLTVDDAFLKEIESWRELLAKNLALRNNLSQRELNYAVQITLDRIIFLRICEDRNIEAYEQLKKMLGGSSVYQELLRLFHRADEKYNSGLFHFYQEKEQIEYPDEFTPRLVIDDLPLKEIIKNLYEPYSPYLFAILPADVLGQVYERFLGKEIVLSGAHKVTVVDKPAIRKAKGVFYTPTFIVNYIVESTIGKLCEGKTPKQVTSIRILDPACGSGSFLLGAYKFLLDWHLAWYLQNGAEKHKKQLHKNERDEWRLTTWERKRILLNNIFGVDIDSQAVEVTKLSLLLKVLEGESAESLSAQLPMFQERALPDLGNNIKSGNSLIGTDFYSNKQMGLLDEEFRYRVNVFDWETEFPRIMQNGGFDAVIGNPPWGADFLKEETDYLVGKYPSIPTKTKDSYLYFIFKAIDLLRDGGYLGFIVPNTWLLINSAIDFRRDLLSYNINEIIDFGDGVFKKATVESATLVLINSKSSKANCRAKRIRKGQLIIDHSVDKSIWLQDQYCRVILEMDNEVKAVLDKIQSASETFDKCCKIIWGIKPYQVGYGIPPQTQEMVDNRIYHSKTKKGDEWKPLLIGSDVNRYTINFPGDQFIKYGKWLMYPSNEKLMRSPKILLRQTSDILRACYDESGLFCQNSVFIIHSTQINLKYLLGLLNSTLFRFAYKLGNPQTGKVFAEIKPSVIKNLPIRKINPNDTNQKVIHDQIIENVDLVMSLHKRLATAQLAQEKAMLQRQISAADLLIDRLIYKLYNLTDSEIQVVEKLAAN